MLDWLITFSIDIRMCVWLTL